MKFYRFPYSLQISAWIFSGFLPTPQKHGRYWNGYLNLAFGFELPLDAKFPGVPSRVAICEILSAYTSGENYMHFIFMSQSLLMSKKHTGTQYKTIYITASVSYSLPSWYAEHSVSGVWTSAMWWLQEESSIVDQQDHLTSRICKSSAKPHS